MEHGKRLRDHASRVTYLYAPFLCVASSVLEFTGQYGAASALVEAAEQSCDFVDGKLGRKAAKAGHPGGEIASWRGIWTGLRTAREQGTPLVEFLNEIDPKWGDKHFDKARQNAKRFALFLNGKIGYPTVLVPIIRDSIMSDSDEMYTKLHADLSERTGTETSHSLGAGWSGKAKTAVMAADFLYRRTHHSREHPALRRSITTLGTAMVLHSALDYTVGRERHYVASLAEAGEHSTILETYNTIEPSASELMIGGLTRTLSYTLNKWQDRAAQVGLLPAPNPTI